jgi:hypothetical protein
MQHPLPIVRIKGFHSYTYPHLKTTYMDVLVKFSLLHINMEVTHENKNICVNQVFLYQLARGYHWHLLTSIIELGFWNQCLFCFWFCKSQITKQEETMNYNDWKVKE